MMGTPWTTLPKLSPSSQQSAVVKQDTPALPSPSVFSCPLLCRSQSCFSWAKLSWCLPQKARLCGLALSSRLAVPTLTLPACLDLDLFAVLVLLSPNPLSSHRGL